MNHIEGRGGLTASRAGDCWPLWRGRRCVCGQGRSAYCILLMATGWTHSTTLLKTPLMSVMGVFVLVMRVRSQGLLHSILYLVTPTKRWPGGPSEGHLKIPEPSVRGGSVYSSRMDESLMAISIIEECVFSAQGAEPGDRFACTSRWSLCPWVKHDLLVRNPPGIKLNKSPTSRAPGLLLTVGSLVT